MEHAEIGGQVLKGWNFPEDLVSAVWHHHNPGQDRLHEQLAAYVHLGDIIAHCLRQGQKYEFYALRTQAEALQILQIIPQDMDTFVFETDAALKRSSGFTRTKS